MAIIVEKNIDTKSESCYNVIKQQNGGKNMIIVDKNIRIFLTNGMTNAKGQTAIYNGDESCITNIGYDLRAEFFVNADGEEVTSCVLAPGESAVISSMERIAFDNQTIGTVHLKNSRIRMGLTMDAPVYQPGHETNIFFRITNISNESIKLKSGEKYAMLIFEHSDEEPDQPYNGQFQNERKYLGLSGYKSRYDDQIEELNEKKRDLKTLEKSIYGNVVTLLTIFIAIFSILNVNISLAAKATEAIHYLIFNLSTIGAISFLAALLNEVFYSGKKSHRIWWIPTVCFAVLTGIVVFSLLI